MSAAGIDIRGCWNKIVRSRTGFVVGSRSHFQSQSTSVGRQQQFAAIFD
ncbi:MULTISPECIES: hypothetical protein [Microcoleaceae]|nr:hypothetical protein [Tychonema sp. LEGE 06208]MBE9161225.1 hypothetical protein [Tychonema sp. LEGE 06208]